MADYNPLKRTLGDMLDKRKQEKAQEESERQRRNDEDRNKILENVGKDFGSIMEPHLKSLQEHSKMSSEELKRIISESVQVTAPNVDTAPIVQALSDAFSNFSIPEPKVNVAAPVIPTPIVNLPPAQVNFPTLMKVLLEGIDRKNPIPVQMVDLKGQPFYDFGGGAGSRGPSVISDIINSKGYTLIDSTTTPSQPALRISGTISAAAASSVSLVNADGTYYNSDNPLPVSFTAASIQPVSQVSGAAWSVVVNEIFGTTGTNTINPDGRLKVELPTGSSGLTDTELRATSLTTQQLSGATDSVKVTGFDTSIAASIIDSSGVQYSGSNPFPVGGTLVVSSITASTAVVNLDRDGNPASAWQVYPSVTGLNETNTNVLRTVQMTDATSSVNITTFNGTAPATGLNENTAGVLKVAMITSVVESANIVTFNGNAPATGLNETTSGVLRTVLMTDSSVSTVVNSGTLTAITNTLTTNQLSGATDSVFVTGFSDSIVVYQARRTNITPLADGSDVRPVADDLGRQITRPFQMRDLTLTAYVSLTNGTETTLLAASAGNLHDLVWIMAANTSSAAQQIDIREVTAGNIVMQLYIPANSTAGIAPALPWPQSSTGNNWTVDNADVTNSTINVTALFVREV